MEYKEKYEEIVKTVNNGELFKCDNARQEDIAHKIVVGYIRNLVMQEDFYRRFYKEN